MGQEDGDERLLRVPVTHPLGESAPKPSFSPTPSLPFSCHKYFCLPFTFPGLTTNLHLPALMKRISRKVVRLGLHLLGEVKRAVRFSATSSLVPVSAGQWFLLLRNLASRVLEYFCRGILFARKVKPSSSSLACQILH